MLQQMLREEKEDAVRESAARSLAVLLAYVDDEDKFSQVSLRNIHYAMHFCCLSFTSLLTISERAAVMLTRGAFCA